MSVRLFVGNLPYDVTESEVREFFSPAGVPLSVRMPTDRETGKPRGFAFVEFGDAAQAEEAVRRFHQQVFKGRPLVVNEARPREEGPGPRPSTFAPPSRPGMPSASPMDRAPRPEQPARNFGPDAPPRGKRKSKGYAPKGERTVKKPIRERGGGQFFAGAVDDSQDEAADDVAFWMRAEPEEKDEE
jgi:RNA recognition motif-containing protein